MRQILMQKWHQLLMVKRETTCHAVPCCRCCINTRCMFCAVLIPTGVGSMHVCSVLLYSG